MQHRRLWRLALSQPAGATWLGRTHLAGLNVRGGGSRAPTCSADESTALSHVATARETLQIMITLYLRRVLTTSQKAASLASFCRWPGRGDQMDVTSPSLWLRPLQSRNWNPAKKIPAPLLGEFFPYVIWQLFFFYWKNSIICNKE